MVFFFTVDKPTAVE